jgi:hypothetical protein
MGATVRHPDKDEWERKCLDAVDAGGGEVKLPNGDAISVERVPDWSER